MQSGIMNTASRVEIHYEHQEYNKQSRNALWTLIQHVDWRYIADIIDTLSRVEHQGYNKESGYIMDMRDTTNRVVIHYRL